MIESTASQIHVVIPAAGHSRRMGQPKLLMQLNGETLIARLLRQLSTCPFASISVLARNSDKLLQQAFLSAHARLVTPDHDSQDMRESVELLVKDLHDNFTPGENAGWLLIPGDHPVVKPQVLESLLDHWSESPDHIVLPTFQSRRGHPTLFPWASTACLSEIPRDQGLNWLTRSGHFTVSEAECNEESILWDIDTPEDFERIRQIFEN